MFIGLLIIYAISAITCLVLSYQSEKFLYGENTPHNGLELITVSTSFVPLLNSFVVCVLVYYYLKNKVNTF